MPKRTTTVRIPEELPEKADIISRGLGISINSLMLEALEAEIEHVRDDAEFMETLKALAERDKGILDRLAA